MEKKIEAAPVTRDAQGWYEHPDLPPFDEGDTAKFKEWIDAHGLEVQRVWMEIDAAPLCGRYMDDDTDALKEWRPTTPVGADWFLLAIFDTEDDGPVAYFVRPAPAAT